MKYLFNISFFILLLSSSLIFADQSDLTIPPMSEQRIAAKQVKLQKELAFHSKIQGVFVVAGGALTALSVYKLIRDISSEFKVMGMRQQLDPTTIQEEIIKCAKSVGWLFIQTTGALIVNKTLSPLLDKVMHDESLAWWITTHAPYQQTVELMEEVAFQYGHAMNPQDAARQQMRFVVATHALFDQFEFVIAFMRYKSKSGTANQKKLKHEIQAVAQERMAVFGANLQKCIDANDASALSELIKQCKAELNKDLIRFAYNDQ